jgi:hypothetical protein
LTTKVQEKYLALCQLFIDKTVPAVCADVVENVVRGVVGDVTLGQVPIS